MINCLDNTHIYITPREILVWYLLLIEDNNKIMIEKLLKF